MNKEELTKWIPLVEESQIDALTEQSHDTPVLIYKHSTRCATSSVVFHRLERHRQGDQGRLLPFFFLDLIAYRSVSDRVASRFSVEHESPQAILIFKGKPIYAASHFSIDYPSIMRQAALN